MQTLAATPIDVTEALMAVKVERLLRSTKTTLKPPHTLTKAEWPPNYEEVFVWRKQQLAKFELKPHTLLDAKAYYAKPENCVDFINHWCDTHDPRNANTDKLVWMPFILFKRQEELVQFFLECLRDDQPGLVEKCRTMGASWVFVCISVWLWLFHPGVAVGWGSQDADSVDQIGNPKSIFFKIRGLIERLPDCFKPEGMRPENLKHMVCSNPETGSSIVGEVGDKIGRGGRTRVFFKDESAHYMHPELIEASLSENTRVPIDVSSVFGLGNLFHRKREAGMDWYPGCDIPRGITRVFVMDWTDHPEFDRKWYEEKKQYHINQATLHVFAQEIERNYSASVQGTIIPSEWLDACVGAAERLGIKKGPKISGLDIGDSEDGDRNAQAVREGIILTEAEEWTARDPGVTARRAIGKCVSSKIPELQYDAGGGLGSNVKSQVNVLKDDDSFPKNLKVIPWNPGGKVLNPSGRVVPDDTQSPRNKNFFTNLKAQAWWALRERVYKTYKLIMELDGGAKLEDLVFDEDDLFSIDPSLPLLQKVKKELCQATASKGAKLKLLVDKNPEGTKSPNIGDSIVMAYWPVPDIFGQFADIGMGAKIFVGGETL